MPNGRLSNNRTSNAALYREQDDPYATIADRFFAVAEPALAMGSGLLAEIPAGWAGITAMLPGGRTPAEAVESTRDYWTYEPRSRGGQAGMQQLGEGIEAGMERAARNPVVRNTLDLGGMGMDYALQRWPEAAPFALAAATTGVELADPTRGGGRAARRAGALAGRSPSIGVDIRQGRLSTPESGSGARGQVLKEDAARTLERLHGQAGRRVADPATTRGMNTMVDRGVADVEYQLEQPITGQDWYDEDMVRTRRLLEEYFDPRYGDPNVMRLWTGVAAPTSYGTPVPSNANVATQITNRYLDTGRIPSTNPDTGKLWTMRQSGRQGLELTQYLIDRFGLEGYGDFMTSKHPIRDLAQLRMESGVFKPGGRLTDYKNVAGRLDDQRYGAYILGEKGGPFLLNLNQIDDTTVDLWQMRNFGRNRGQILHPVSGQIIDAPISPAMRQYAKEYGRRVGERLGLGEQGTQAIQWYFEQQLYAQMGVSGANPRSFSEGVEALARKLGRLTE